MTPHESSPLPNWEQGVASQQGGRHEQQDRWGIFQLPGQDKLLAVVADGMGGHLDGALGAQIVIDVARNFVQNPPDLLHARPPVALDQLCQRMHDAINRQSETARSTVVMIWIDGNQAHWLNIGDSRLYHFRNGRRLMRTRDHSAVQLLIDLGEIDESQMGSHPAQNRLYRCLGGMDTPKPDAGHFTVQVGDLLALCSDGIWEYVDEHELWTTALAHGPTTAAPLLAEQAVHRGGPTADNATLLLLRAEASPDNPSHRDPPHWLRRFSARLAALFSYERR